MWKGHMEEWKSASHVSETMLDFPAQPQAECW